MLQIAHFGTAALANDENDIRWLYGPLFLRNMANHSELFPFVTNFTVLTRQLAQYCEGNGGEKDYESIRFDSIA